MNSHNRIFDSRKSLQWIFINPAERFQESNSLDIQSLRIIECHGIKSKSLFTSSGQSVPILGLVIHILFRCVPIWNGETITKSIVIRPNYFKIDCRYKGVDTIKIFIGRRIGSSDKRAIDSCNSQSYASQYPQNLISDEITKNDFPNQKNNDVQRYHNLGI